MRDYEELARRLREAPSDWPDAELHYEVADAIEELQSYADLYKELTEKGQTVARKLIDAYPKWISVEERLPEVDQPVMICAFGQSVGEGVYRGHDGFHHVWKMYASSGTYWDDEVTHYMPLPDPPKEDDDNGRN